MSKIDELMNRIALNLWGMTPFEAHQKRICIACGRKIDIENWSELDIKEYNISALCPHCFDDITIRRNKNA